MRGLLGFGILVLGTSRRSTKLPLPKITAVIKAPFANYHPATLERLVQEGFDRIEQITAAGAEPMDLLEFQTLMAADAFLRRAYVQPLTYVTRDIPCT